MNLQTKKSSKTIDEIKNDILYIDYRKVCKKITDLRLEMVMDDYQAEIKPLLDKLKRRTNARANHATNKATY